VRKAVILASDADLTGRARLRSAALQLFAERGVAGASARDIAEAAGVTAGLIRHYFGSKEKLKAEADDLMLQAFTEPLKIPAKGRPEERMAAVGRALAETMAAHPELRAYLRRSLLENDLASSQVFNQFVRLVRDLLREMQAAELLREDLDTIWVPFQILFLHFGPLLLGPAVEQLLGVDAYAKDAIHRRSHATLELLRRGLLRAPMAEPRRNKSVRRNK
jgi:TetR/AcrR family transcriptional regulator, regulator of cefoperazone and chloramphenicol sensitivity